MDELVCVFCFEYGPTYVYKLRLNQPSLSFTRGVNISGFLFSQVSCGPMYANNLMRSREQGYF